MILGRPGGDHRPGRERGTITTIPVTVKLTDPEAARSLDQAPVTVNITTATVDDALAVPVTALLARSPGGYGVGGRPGEHPALRAGDAGDLR